MINCQLRCWHRYKRWQQQRQQQQRRLAEQVRQQQRHCRRQCETVLLVWLLELAVLVLCQHL
jgi:hypothetical protein